MSAICVEAQTVCKAFESGAACTTVLNGLSISFRRGEVALISGPSGCGKSTLLAILSGLLQPDSGTVQALGVRLDGRSERDLDQFRLRHTGFVFQSFHLFSALTALEQVMLPLGYLGFDMHDARALARKTLCEMGLEVRMRARPAELSGGERQRVALARALAKGPSLLFADEPTSALDAVNGQAVIELLSRVARRNGTTVICVSHDPRIDKHADRIFRMEDGQVKAASGAAIQGINHTSRQTCAPL